MYSEKLVVAVKANGKVLREFKDIVYVPFDSEYSLLVKNLNSVRALVNITIDGTDVVPGGLVVNANSEVDLERFVKDMSTGNKFKFIERTENIENHRGVKAEDGLIRVAFKFEKVNPYLIAQRNYDYDRIWGQPQWGSNSHSGVPCADYTSSVLRGGAVKGITTTAASLNSVTFSAQSDVGITVPGSISNQKFITVSDFATETTEHVIILKLVGDTGQQKVEKPVTVETKPKCQTCGKVNKATSKFCTECGTSLSII
jgi:hypothetical protein